MVTAEAIQGVDRPMVAAAESVLPAAPASRVRSRRRWIIRSAVTLALGAACVGLVTVVHRDQTAITSAVAGVREVGEAVRLAAESLGRLPASVELRGTQPKTFYLDDSVRLYANQTGESVIVAAGPPVDLVLLRDGRAILHYERGRVRAEWVSEAGFRELWSRQEERIRAFEHDLRSRPPVLP